MAGTIIYGIDGKNQIWEVDATAGTSQVVNANPGVDGKLIAGASNAFAYDTARDQFLFVDSSARLLFWDRTTTGASSLKVVATSSQLGVSKLPNDAAFFNDAFWFIADGTTKLTQIKLHYDSASGLPTFGSQTSYQITGSGLPNLSFGDVAINQKTGIFYGATSGGAFFAIDLNSLNGSTSVNLSTIKSSGNPSLQIAFDGDYTNLYGVNVNDGNWYKINTTTGLAAKTGKVTVGFNDIGGSATTSAAGLDAAYADEAGGVLNQTPGHDATGNVLSNDTGVGLKVSNFSFGLNAGTIGQSLAGAYGSIILQSDGSFIYTVDNNNPSVESLLSSAQTITDVFDYTAKDINGVTNTTQLRIIISGANDAPVAIADWARPLTVGNPAPDGNQARGNVLKNDTDVDKGDTHTVSAIAHNARAGLVGVATSGDYGSLIINADGSYTYTLDGNNAAVKALNQGQVLTDVFQYTNKDSAGLTSSSTLTIEIQGPNSIAPIVNPDTSSSPGARAAIEKGGFDNNTGGQSAVGNVLGNDLNSNSNGSLEVSGVSFGGVAGIVGQAVSGNYGALIIHKDGGYEYIVDDNSPIVQALNVGDALYDTFTYAAQNSEGLTASTTLNIKILGANDAPVANPVVAGPIIVGAQNSVSGDVLSNDTDIDKNDVGYVSADGHGNAKGVIGQALVGDYGSLVLQSDGSFLYNVDSSNATVKALKSGDEIKDVFTYTHTDAGGLSATSTLTIAILGNGTVNITPPVVTPDTSASPGATPAIEKGGYNNNVPGQNATGNVLANDTTNNAHDALIVSSVSFNGYQQTAGAPIHGNYGTLTLGADGNYSYIVDDNSPIVQALNVGDALYDTFTYAAQNSEGLTASTTLNIKILGANDAPVANPIVDGPIVAGNYAPGGNQVLGNVLANDTEIDFGDALKISSLSFDGKFGNVGSYIAGHYGWLVLELNGDYTYMLDNANDAVKSLPTGQLLSEIFSYTEVDKGGLSATSNLLIKIVGSAVGATTNYDDHGSVC